ncbi:hypothetical protein EZS27_025049 [termite gut metagenome]|uniref:Carbohydrate-binding domain-containing protein n=1 Tax=termite gut metagenome TaxID=433724 RepID=A0A5J4QZA7_9ZZZZ
MLINVMRFQRRKYAGIVLILFGMMNVLVVLCSSAMTKNNMKELKVKKINAVGLQVDALPALLNKENVAFVPITNVNWAEKYSYRPEVSFRLAYADNAFLLHFKVKEGSVRARYGNDNGSVWTDSCVEFFVIPCGDGIYYNIECNCIGTVLVGAGNEKSGHEHAAQDVMNGVQRWSSLGRLPFEERIGETDWEVALIIPYTVFFKHKISSLDGKTLKGNFYKCGDELQTPHFLSWNPIETESPNFHVPEYFGTLVLE